MRAIVDLWVVCPIPGSAEKPTLSAWKVIEIEFVPTKHILFTPNNTFDYLEPEDIRFDVQETAWRFTLTDNRRDPLDYDEFEELKTTLLDQGWKVTVDL